MQSALPETCREISAVDLVQAAVSALGGQGGGGRPNMAPGGGPDGAKDEPLDAVKDALGKVRLAFVNGFDTMGVTG